MTTTPNLILRDTIAILYFDMSDFDPNTLIDNIGYGFAAGFLSTLPLHGASLPSLSATHTNPITGQFIAAEEEARNLQGKSETEMTDEEKEREAERLFVLFDRLNKTGVIKVKNPAREVQEVGRMG